MKIRKTALDMSMNPERMTSKIEETEGKSGHKAILVTIYVNGGVETENKHFLAFNLNIHSSINLTEKFEKITALTNCFWTHLITIFSKSVPYAYSQ